MTTNNKNRNNFRKTLAVYLISIVLGNLLVYWLGPGGILITSFVFIPFDFIIRCYIHELYRGKKLYGNLFLIVVLGGGLTYLMNSNAKDIAIASVCGFVSATAIGSLIYQMFIKKTAFLKVNGSDIFALIVDSLVFQSLAFHHIIFAIIFGQICIKALGGLAWYYFLIQKYDLINKINRPVFFVDEVEPWTPARGQFILETYLYLKCNADYYVIELTFYSGARVCIGRMCWSGHKFVATPPANGDWIQLFNEEIPVAEIARARRKAEREAKSLILIYAETDYDKRLKSSKLESTLS